MSMWLAVVVVATIAHLPALARDIPERCKEFLEYGLPATQGALLCRTGFALAHDEARKAPIWVAQRMTPERLVNRVSRRDRFLPDPELPMMATISLWGMSRSTPRSAWIVSTPTV